jgi:hypothetical protein
MQTSNLSITFWQNVSKKKLNNAPLYARITVNGKRREISLGRSIPINLWSKSKKRMIGRTSTSQAVNLHIEQIHLNLLECQRQLKQENKSVTAEAIKAYYFKSNKSNDSKMLTDLIEYHFKIINGLLKPSTISHYYTTKKYLTQFLCSSINQKDIDLKDISFEFIIDF